MGKLIKLLLIIALTAGVAAAVVFIILPMFDEQEIVEIPAQTYEHVSEDDFNRDLFYMNTLEFQVADPTVIYAEHGEGAGYFYAFGTSDLIGGHGIQCWRSKDLANWEYTGVALQPDPLDTWAVNHYWAPEVIYDDSDGLYYLFYNANKIGSKAANSSTIRCLSVAYSENVMGPYKFMDGVSNFDGEMLEADQPVIDFQKNADKLPKGVAVRDMAIDPSPFIDPKTGEKYLYWSWFDEKKDGQHNQRQEIFAMKMTDWFTPQYDTVTQITEVGKTTVGGSTDIFEGGNEKMRVNEGPSMYYKDGTYFLTFSCYYFKDPSYQVRVATSDNPLSGFTKLNVEDGGVVLSTDPTWPHIVSSGHHQFVEVGDQLLVVYHTFKDRDTIEGGRALAVDEVFFVKNSKGKMTMHTNGPTYSLQPIPSLLSGYANVADKATVEATNLKDGSSEAYLKDNLVKTKDIDLATETEFNEGKTEIKFSFKEAQELKAVMVYNSYHIDTAFVEIESIELEYICNEKGKTAIAKIGKVPFDYDFYTYYYADMLPGAAAIAEFENLPVVSVKITINSSTAFNVSEIKLLGATNKTLEYKESFSETYTYNNEVVLNHFVNEGTTLGGTEFYEATYGWDFTHDDGTNNAYVTTDGIGDSYVYFKDITATKFYAEAYLSTYSYEAFVMGNSYDKWPKIGMVVRNAQSSLFFYVDAQNEYTLKTVGYVQSVYGNTGSYDWQGTEKLEDVDIVYRNNELNLEENYVKLAILRDGKNFYMLVNDQFVFKADKLRNLGFSDLASVGFLGFNSPLVIKDYSITLDSAEIDQIISEIKTVSEGETLGNGVYAQASSGWNLTYDDGSDDAYVTSNKINDVYTYFKEDAKTTFYAEAYLATTSLEALNNDKYPKFGMIIRNEKAGTVFYVNGENGFTSQKVGIVQSQLNNPGVWAWNTSRELTFNISYANSQLDLDGNFVKLAILRDGDTFYMFVNDELAFVTNDLYALGLEDAASVGFVGFNTQLVIKNYQLITDEIVVKNKLNELDKTEVGKTLDTKLTSAGFDVKYDSNTESIYLTSKTPVESTVDLNIGETTKFYTEAYFASTSLLALANDGYPKFGFMLSTAKSKTFFYVDGSQAFTAQTVGYVQTEKNNPAIINWNSKVESYANIAYGNGTLNLNGNFVKLGVLRDGKTFYFFVNDQLVFVTDKLTSFGEEDIVSLAIISYNSPLVVKNIVSITEESQLDVLVENVSKMNSSETLGDSKYLKQTYGWDLTHADETEHPYVSANKGKDASIYFKEDAVNKFYVEAYFATTKTALLNDAYPKFGFVVGNTSKTFFYVDARDAYTGQTVGYVNSKNEEEWYWEDSVEYSVNMKYDNETLSLDGDFVKLAILRDGKTFYFFVNDQLVCKTSDLVFTAKSLTNVGFLAYNTELLVKDYKLIVDTTLVDQLKTDKLN